MRYLSAAGVKSTFSDAQTKGKITLPKLIEQRRAPTSSNVIVVMEMVPCYPETQQHKCLTNDSVFGSQAEMDRLANIVGKYIRKSLVIPEHGRVLQRIKDITRRSTNSIWRC